MLHTWNRNLKFQNWYNQQNILQSNHEILNFCNGAMWWRWTQEENLSLDSHLEGEVVDGRRHKENNGVWSVEYLLPQALNRIGGWHCFSHDPQLHLPQRQAPRVGEDTEEIRDLGASTATCAGSKGGQRKFTWYLFCVKVDKINKSNVSIYFM